MQIIPQGVPLVMFVSHPVVSKCLPFFRSALRGRSNCATNIGEVGAAIQLEGKHLCMHLSRSGHPSSQRVVVLISDLPINTFNGGRCLNFGEEAHLMKIRGGVISNVWQYTDNM